MIRSKDFFLILNDTLGSAAISGVNDGLVSNACFIDDVKRTLQFCKTPKRSSHIWNRKSRKTVA